MLGYYLIDTPRSGPANMAADQCMLERSAAENIPLIRFYQWQRPTLSLGYFQKYEDRLVLPSSQQIEVVRRATGGGAIVHHFDWTYAVSIPNSLLGTGKSTSTSIGASQRLYESVHSGVVSWLCGQGWNARMWDATCPAATSTGTGCSFLCFHRRSKGDIVIGDSKVMGSAQRRLPGAVLQHGSLLLQRSPHTPSLPGLRELPNSITGQIASSSVDEHLLNTVPEFREQILSALHTLISVSFEPLACATELLPNVNLEGDSAFSAASWTRKV